MTVLILTHPACAAHRPPAGHPERPERLAAVMRALDRPEFASLPRQLAEPATSAMLARAHTPAHLAAMAQAAERAQTRPQAIDPDTTMSRDSHQAALLSAGSGVQAVRAVLSGTARRVFCAVRPPGHHAEANRAMGFCFYSNIAIAALAALDAGLARVAVMDFDVHHGNGTQDILANEPRAFFASTHQWPLYPGTGAAHETGSSGNVLNVPLPSGCDGARFRAAMTERVLPALAAFRPELLFISAGFDAHQLDPLGGMQLEDADFHWATAQLCALANDHAQGRVVSMLEGGYNLSALETGVAAHLRALMES